MCRFCTHLPVVSRLRGCSGLLTYTGGSLMSYMEAIKSGFSNYAKFNGRASRSEFWWFALFMVVVYVVLYALLALVGGVNTTSASGEAGVSITGVPFFIVAVVWLIFLLPILGLQWRRLHDANHSGAWWLLNFVPFVGGIVLLIFFATPGTEGDNRFGPPVTTAVN